MSNRGIWAAILAVAGLDALLLSASDFSLRWQPELGVAGAVVLLVTLWWIYRDLRPAPRLAALAQTGLYYVLYTNALGVLSYLLTGLADRPLLDDAFAAFDHALGFDWLAYHRWFMQAPLRYVGMQMIYLALGPQLILLIVLLDAMEYAKRARELFVAFLASSMITVVLGALLPAAGAFVHYGTPEAHTKLYVQQYLALRDGSLRVIDLSRAQGLVWFPSFHAALAVLCAWAVRGIPRLFWPMAILDVLIVAVTPAGGGHYLADVLAGLALGALTIAGVPGRMPRS